MPRSVWPTLVGATFGVMLGHWLVMAGILLDAGNADAGFTYVLIGAGCAVLAGTILVAGVATGSESGAALAAAFVGAAVAGVIWALRSAEVPLVALVSGLGVGAALAVRRRPEHLLWVRFLMVAVIVGYVWWVTDFSAAFAIIVTPLLPFPTVGIADFASEREAIRRSHAGYAARR